ncbi:MAG: hypothetical protein WD075_06260 [Rhodospirillales bacterium]
MSRFIKAGLFATASAIALVSTPITPAHAFDQVNWTWNADVTEKVKKTVNVTIDMTPAGMVMVEDLQVNIGDVTATSVVNGIDNTQPQEGGTADLGIMDIQFHYGLGSSIEGEGVVVLDDDFKSPEVLSGSVDEGDEAPNINGTVLATIDLGEVDVPATQSFDALTDLPSVVSAATAVANNSSISSDTSLELHEGQFAFNTGEGSSGGFDGIDTGNSNLSLTTVLGIQALNGNLGSSNVEAKSRVFDILNASVDSSATAVVNNMSISLAPAASTDSLVIADIVQFAYADVTATSRVRDISLNNYTGLGGLTSPVVNSVATAVGNNKSITVAAPVVAAPAL